MDIEKLEQLYDVAILRHSFTIYNRDYEFFIENGIHDDPGQYRLCFKNVYELKYSTLLAGQTLRESLPDFYTDYDEWQKSGEKEGFIWGVNYSLAYPGFKVLTNTDAAQRWTTELGIPMFEIHLTTNTYKLEYIASDYSLTKINDDHSFVNKLFHKLK